MSVALARLGRGLRESREPILVFLVTRGRALPARLPEPGRPAAQSGPQRRDSGGGPWRGFPTNLWLDGWARWDAGWYEHIAKHGYVDQAVGPAGQRNLAFYPLYPLTMRLLSLAGPEPLPAGILISNLALLAALLLLHRMARARFGAESGIPVRAADEGVSLLLLLQRRLLGEPVPAAGRRRAVPR